jgi:hypothetical protein
MLEQLTQWGILGILLGVAIWVLYRVRHFEDDM